MTPGHGFCDKPACRFSPVLSGYLATWLCEGDRTCEIIQTLVDSIGFSPFCTMHLNYVTQPTYLRILCVSCSC